MIVLHLKKVWFDKIKSGEKIHEYREQQKWVSTFANFFLNPAEGNNFAFLCDVGDTYEAKGCQFKDDGIIELCCGYPSRRPEDQHKWLKAKVVNITTNVDGRETDLDIDEPVLDIELRLI